MGSLLLKEVCRKSGVTRRAVQGYEKQGLVSPCGKNKMGYLLYDYAALEKIKQIKQFQKRGFSLKEIKKMESMPSDELKITLEIRLEILKRDKSRICETIDIIRAMINSL